MSEELVVRQCAPTLAGIKTGSLFSCPCGSPEELRQEVRRINRLLAGLIWQLDGIWFSIVGAEFMAAIVTALFLIGKQKKYHY